MVVSYMGGPRNSTFGICLPGAGRSDSVLGDCLSSGIKYRHPPEHVLSFCRFKQERESLRIQEAKAELLKCSQVILSFQWVPPGASNELLANLWMFRNRLATVRHDKIYALLGLIQSETSRIQAEYWMPFAKVCSSVVIEDIKSSGNLNALNGTRKSLQWSKTPSWNIDWSCIDY